MLVSGFNLWVVEEFVAFVGMQLGNVHSVPTNVSLPANGCW
jgi:hypothetical protein